MTCRRFVLVLLCGFSSFISAFNRVYPAVLFDELAWELDVPVNRIGFCGGAFFLGCAASQPIAQALALKFDIGILLGASTLLAALGSVFFGLSRNLAVACLSRVVVGLGMGPVALFLGELMRSWFPRRTFVTMSGIVSLMGSAGAMLAQGPLASFLFRIDWRFALYSLAAISATGALVVLVFVRARAEPRENTSLDGSNGCVLGGSLLIEEVKSSPVSTSFVGTRQFWGLMGYFAFVPSVFLNVTCLWVGPYLADYFVYTGVETGYIQVTGTLGALFGVIIMAMLMEKIGRKTTMLVGVLLTVLVVGGMALIKRVVDNVAVIVCLFLFGFCAMGPMPGAVGLLRDMDTSVLLVGYGDMFTYGVTGLLQILTACVMMGMCKSCDDFGEKELGASLWIPSLVSLLLGAASIMFVRETSGDQDYAYEKGMQLSRD